ncbi:hypothetical protein QQF64_033733 [Cirrhinus molitorella]|uniref:Uncharacterized protein n=1 Tax=Cirrhinus molitorella TaxID=172907 RepID=A0ABR3MUQ5_9TELE
MSDQELRCLPPCQRQLSDDDQHTFCFKCLGEEHAVLGLEGECEHCNLLPFKVLHARLAFFKESSWGSRVDLAKAHETDPPLALTLSLDREVLASASRAGQAGASLHTMAVLQAYQADLLKDLSTGGSIDEEAFSELRQATDLSLRATKQTAQPHGHQGQRPCFPP